MNCSKLVEVVVAEATLILPVPWPKTCHRPICSASRVFFRGMSPCFGSIRLEPGNTCRTRAAHAQLISRGKHRTAASHLGERLHKPLLTSFVLRRKLHVVGCLRHRLCHMAGSGNEGTRPGRLEVASRREADLNLTLGKNLWITLGLPRSGLLNLGLCPGY